MLLVVTTTLTTTPTTIPDRTTTEGMVTILIYFVVCLYTVFHKSTLFTRGSSYCFQRV